MGNTYSKNYESIITVIRIAFPDFKEFIVQKTVLNVRLLWNDRYPGKLGNSHYPPSLMEL